ncbi:hypothetical protein Rs2_15963 [Raphanus sativus]|nr:hypothetical protein Rs2_15963 [Raphanus sativus]
MDRKASKAMNEYKLHRRKKLHAREPSRGIAVEKRRNTYPLNRGKEEPWRGIAVEKRTVERNRRGEENRREESPWRTEPFRREPSRGIRGEEEPSKGRAVEKKSRRELDSPYESP